MILINSSHIFILIYVWNSISMGNFDCLKLNFSENYLKSWIDCNNFYLFLSYPASIKYIKAKNSKQTK